MASNEPPSNKPSVDRFLTLLRKNLLEPDIRPRVEQIRRRAKRNRLKKDLEDRKN